MIDTEPTSINNENIVHWRNLLEKRKKTILEAGESYKRHAFQELGMEETGEISNIRLHAADLATNTQTIEVLESLSEQNVQRLQEIEDAIDRLNKGQYGKCLNCDTPISSKRLNAIPEAKFCIECEQDFEDNKNKFSSPYGPQASTQFIELNKELEALKTLTAESIMQANPITLQREEDLNTAINLMSDNNIRHLPVVDSDGNIQGIISDRDILSVVLKVKPWLLEEKIQNPYHQIHINVVMTKTPETVSPDTSLIDVCNLLLENKISCLPVVEGNHLIGIITEADFVKLIGQGLA